MSSDSSSQLADISQYFDSDGGVWINAYGDNKSAWNEYFHLRFRERYACELIAGENKGVAVDLGCGPGHALVRMRKMGFEKAIGVDISDRMLESAQELIDKNEMTDTIDLHKADVCRLDMIESSSVDAVTALGVIEYLRNDVEFLAEIRRILRPGGVAVVQTRNASWIHARFRGLIGQPPNPKIWCQEHSPSRVRKIAKEAGLEVDASRYCHYYALYPFDKMPGLKKPLRSVDRFLSKKLEVLSGSGLSRWFASMYIPQLRKPLDAPDEPTREPAVASESVVEEAAAASLPGSKFRS